MVSLHGVCIADVVHERGFHLGVDAAGGCRMASVRGAMILQVLYILPDHGGFKIK
jgi:hypothetical protein